MIKRVVIAFALLAGVAAAGTLQERFFAAWWSSADTDITQNLAHFFDPGGTGSSVDSIGGVTGVISGPVSVSTNGWTFPTGSGNANRSFVTFSRPITNALPEAYAFSLWIKPLTTVMTNQTFGGWIFAKRGPLSLGPWDFQLAYNTAARLSVAARDTNAPASYTVGLTGTTTNDAWIHVAYVADYDARQTRIYYNGSVVDAATIPEDQAQHVFSFNSPNTRLGNQSWDLLPTADLTQYRGVVDKLRIYRNFAPDDNFIRTIFLKDGQAKGLLP